MKLKFLIPWIILIAVICLGAGKINQLIGPSTPTTANALMRWQDSSAYKTINSIVIVDDSGNITGINNQSMAQANIITAYITNGFVFLQKASAPSAVTIGGSVGVSTNYMLVNLNGALMKYWSDGTTVYSQEVGTH